MSDNTSDSEQVQYKKCTNCKEIKNISKFHKDRSRKDGIHYWCKQCGCTRSRKWKTENAEKIKQWRKDNPEKTRNNRLKTRYGISTKDYDFMFEKQEGKCAICEKLSTKLDVDHCHITGEIRGLLCRSCNRSLGWFEPRTNKVLKYLKLDQSISLNKTPQIDSGTSGSEGTA